MNTQIAKLASQAGFDVDSTGKFGNYSEMSKVEKFAELIIRECAEICDNLQDIPATEPRHCAEDIRIHFGVK